MLPIILKSDAVRVGLAGAGNARARREALLSESGTTPVLVEPSDEMSGLTALFIAGFDRETSAALARRARAAGVPVNAEDMPDLCDFNVPAIVRRGDLLLTVSTGGHAPGLARRIREWLEDRFGPEWPVNIEEMSAARDGWRQSGAPPAEVSKRTRDFVAEKGWLS